MRWIDGGADRQAQESNLRDQYPGATQHPKIEGVWSDIAEDGSDPNHLVAFTERDGSSALAKDLAGRGEWAGPCFGGRHALFANIQGDCTYMITGPLATHLNR